MGKKLNLDAPTSFNEKLQWLKLHDRNPLYTTLVDKVRVKTWVADRIGSEYVTPTLAIWNSAEDIDVDELPERFVLKTNHDNGSIVICRDKKIFDIWSAREKLRDHLTRNFFYEAGREWPYKNVQPLVFAEEYLDDSSSGSNLPAGMVDYKFYCFNGLPQFLYVSKGLEDHSTARISFFDISWNRMPFCRSDFAPFEDVPDMPGCLQEMIEISKELSKGIPFVRVDLFEYHGTPRFSEMTFYPKSGYMKFNPEEWDYKIGDMLDLEGAYGLGE